MSSHFSRPNLPPSREFSLFVPLAVLLCSVTLARAVDTVLLDDQFADQERVTQSLPSTAHWYYQGSSSNTTETLANAPYIPMQLLQMSSVGNAAMVNTYFTASGSPRTLAVGDSLQLSFSLTLSATANATDGIRVGLYNSGGSRPTADSAGSVSGDVATYGTNYDGYAVFFNPVNPLISGTIDFKLMERNTFSGGGSPPANMFGLGTNALSSSLGINANTAFPVTLTITRTSASAVEVTANVNGTSITRTDSSGAHISFDDICFFHSSAALVSGQSARLDDVVVTFTPSGGSAQTLMADSFADEERNTQSLPGSAAWFYRGTTVGDPAALCFVPPGGLGAANPNDDMVLNSQGSDITAFSYFTSSGSPKTLADGESLTLRLSTRLSTVANAPGGLRVGLFNSFASRAATDYGLTNPAPANLLTNYRGYSISINPGAASAGGVVVAKRSNSSTATNLFSNAAFANLTSDTNGPNAFPNNTWLRPSLKLSRIGSTMRIETVVNDTTVIATDAVPDTFAFDTIGVFTSASGLPTGNNLRVDDVLLDHSTTIATNITSISTILSQNFNATGTAWPGLAFTNQATTGSVSGLVAQSAVGTIDSVGGLVPSGGLHLDFDSSGAGGAWSAQLLSGMLNVTNSETNLAKLTLAFDLLASSPRPVRVALESFTAGGVSTGKLERRIYPAAAGMFQRFAFELSSMTNSQGSFDPASPKIQLSVVAEGGIGSPFSWPSGSNAIDIDNIHFARPAYYVSPSGNDSNNGRAETVSGGNGPFLTIGKAVAMAKPGDIVLIMGSGPGPHYQISSDPNNNGVMVTNLGAPAGWITFKAYPGHTPEIKNVGWHVFRLGVGFDSSRDRGPGVAYIEVRGLKLRGIADTLSNALKGSSSSGSANTTGITVEGRYMANQPHHVRLADNIICTNSAGGIGVLQGDYISVENNRIYDNCKWSAYAPSGISLYQTWDFGGLPNTYRMFIGGNIATNNQSLTNWVSTGAISDGNGIIIDNFSNSQNQRTFGYYPGRTLVQNNLVTGNGGSGMHAFQSRRVDVVNNTSYQNSQVLSYGELWSNQSDDVRFYNNIMVSPPGEPLNPVLSPGAVGVFFYNNLYQVGAGGSSPAIGSGGTGNITNNSAPIFVNPAVAGGDFRLTNGSPARNLGLSIEMTPATDILGYPRATDGSVDVGAYERQPMILTPPDSISTNAGANVSLSVAALGDGLTYQWTRSGTNLTGETASTLALNNVTTNDSGNYAVVVATSFDLITNAASLTVNALFTPIQIWRQTYFGTAANSGSGADGADPDGDGIVNAMEYALYLNPTNSAPGVGLPIFSFIVTNAQTYGALTFTRVKAATDVTYQPCVRDDLVLGSWTTLTNTFSVLDSGDTEQVTVRDFTSRSSATNRIYQLRVTVDYP